MKIDFKVIYLSPEISHCYENSLIQNLKSLHSKCLFSVNRGSGSNLVVNNDFDGRFQIFKSNTACVQNVK